MKTLTELANEHRSDKGTAWSYKHKYTYLYDLIFWPYRSAPIYFLELGLAVGGPESSAGKLVRSVNSPSVDMWLEYFENAMIYGFDISDFSHINHERFKFIQGDSGIENDLRTLANTAPFFDVIIDDASHASYHQQLAFKTLWERLSPGGLYIIEDLHWQSQLYEQQLPQVPFTRNLLASWFENGTFTPNPLFSHDDFQRISSEAATFAAFPAFNEGTDPAGRRPDNSAKLIVLRKRT